MALTAAGWAFVLAAQAALAQARKARYAGGGCTDTSRLHR
jgi:hypothetical protein